MQITAKMLWQILCGVYGEKDLLIQLSAQNYAKITTSSDIDVQNMYKPLLSFFCFSSLQISCQHSLVHLSWNIKNLCHNSAKQNKFLKDSQ